MCVEGDGKNSTPILEFIRICYDILNTIFFCLKLGHVGPHGKPLLLLT